jgi:hypothetical protein
MAITFNTTVGGASATSYVSVGSADDYMATREESTPWDDISLNSTGTLSATSRKQNLLMQATREIDKTWRFQGSRDGVEQKGSEDYQNLEFPRGENYDADGTLLIPDEVKYATYEQALYIMQRNAVQTAEGENTVKLSKFSDIAYDYIKPWVTRAVMRVGNYSWQGSRY